eukprot:GHVT01045980.1.p1 GENE.GHVT01045980.1~~GHVT01045980.1.p1  ORF type:complete len:744 (+),score=47.18 GHVT01045980.1:700-2931(+)
MASQMTSEGPSTGAERPVNQKGQAPQMVNRKQQSGSGRNVPSRSVSLDTLAEIAAPKLKFSGVLFHSGMRAILHGILLVVLLLAGSVSLSVESWFIIICLAITFELFLTFVVLRGHGIHYFPGSSENSFADSIGVSERNQSGELWRVLVCFAGYALILRGSFSILANDPVVSSLQRKLDLKSYTPSRTYGWGGAESSAVVLGPNGVVLAPYSTDVDALLRAASEPLLMRRPRYVTGDDIAVVIPARDEDEFLVKTVRFLYQETPGQILKEIYVVDDGSKKPAATLLDHELPRHIRKLVKVIRNDPPEGLIRSRIMGADASTASNIVFLDAHCRPFTGWMPPLLAELKENYRRVAVPMVTNIDRYTWESDNTHGVKMMFMWNFEFHWYEDFDRTIPVLSGGILAITRRWWEESGKYDDGMLEWGGENLEQALRLWMCGSEILYVNNSKVGHVFRRGQPIHNMDIVPAVQRNQKRGARVWLDEYFDVFNKIHPQASARVDGDTTKRQQLRRDLQCTKFQWFFDRFRNGFERWGMQVSFEHTHIQHRESGWCMSYAEKLPNVQVKENLVPILEPCDEKSARQQWTPVSGNRMLYNRQAKLCLDGYGFHSDGGFPILFTCFWKEVFDLRNSNQMWQWDASGTSGRIFSFIDKDARTLSGNDVFHIADRKATTPSSFCLRAKVDDAARAAAVKAVPVRYDACPSYLDDIHKTEDGSKESRDLFAFSPIFAVKNGLSSRTGKTYKFATK